MEIVRKLIIILALASAACGTVAQPVEPVQPESTPDSALIEYGIEVYRTNYCGSCHALTVANTHGTFGPSHDDAATRAGEYISLSHYRGEATTATEYIRESILNPMAFYTPGYESTNHHMPAFTHLPDEDIDAMVYLLMQQHDTSSISD